jgi:hypothetical protein
MSFQDEVVLRAGILAAIADLDRSARERRSSSSILATDEQAQSAGPADHLASV